MAGSERPSNESGWPIATTALSGVFVGPADGTVDAHMSGTPRRHHYISRFLMRGFSQAPSARNSPIWRLDKKTGRPSKTSVDNDAVVRDFYRLDDTSTFEANDIEKVLSTIEGIAAGHLARLVAGESLNEVSRFEVASFLVLQHKRTPRGRQWFVEMYEHMQKQIMDVNVNRFDTDEEIRAFLKSEGSDASASAVAAFRKHIDDWRAGRLELRATSDHEVMGMFMASNEVALAIASQTTWTLLKAQAPDEFVLSDHPVCIWDPTALPGHGVGWLSSPATEVTIPLGRDLCLMVTPGRPIQLERGADPRVVADLNLRSYATAEWAYFGATQGVVQGVRALTRRHKAMVHQYEPRKPNLFILEHAADSELMKVLETYRPEGKPVRGFLRPGAGKSAL